MKVKFLQSHLRNILLLLFFLLSHNFYAQEFIYKAPVFCANAKLELEKFIFQKPTVNIRDNSARIAFSVNGNRIEIISNARLGSSFILQPTSGFNSRVKTNWNFVPTMFIDDTVFTFRRIILSFYNRGFQKQYSLIPPTAITGNFSICFPTPGTTQLIGTGIPAVLNPWVSSNTAVATISNTGLVTGLVLGTTTITYTDSLGNNASQNVTVTALPTISGILTKCVGGTTQLTGSGTPNIGTPWTSSNSLIATVTNTGLVTGVSGGSSTMTYQNAYGCSVTAVVTINPLLVPMISCGAATTNQVSFTWPAVFGATTYTVSYNINGTGNVFVGNIGNILTYTKISLSPSDIVTITVTPSGAVGTCFASGIKPCQASACTLMMTPTAPVITSTTQPTCAAPTGSVTITAVAGQTYSVDSDPFSASPNIASISVGAHGIRTQNAAGCLSASTPFTINAQPATPTAPVITSTTQPSCAAPTGSVTITAVAGQTYSVDSDPFSASPNIASISVGAHGIRTQNAAGCLSASTPFTINAQPATPTATATPSLQSICTGESDNIVLSSNIAGTTFDWAVIQNNITGATNGSGNIINQILETTNTMAGSVVYIITPTNSNGCVGNPTTLTITVHPLPIPKITDGVICVNQSTGITIKSYILNTGLNNNTHDFTWTFNGTPIPFATESTFEATQTGLYTVVATNTITGCLSLPVSANITASFAGQTISATSESFSDNPIITVNVTPANSEYLYQLDDSTFQNSNLFPAVTPGLHTVTVTDANGCTDLTTEILVINYPKYFTPNGDGYHDKWNIIGLTDQPTATVYIFDRYGKLIIQISPTGNGWDGTLNGDQLPGTDYWFTVEFMENEQKRTFKSHFALKR